MIKPPIISETQPEHGPAPARNFVGWVIVTILLVLSIAGELAVSSGSNRKNETYSQEQGMILSAARTRAMKPVVKKLGALGGSDTSTSEAELNLAIEKIGLRPKNAAGASLLAQALTLQNKAPTEDQLVPLTSSKKLADRTVGYLYSTSTLDEAHARDLIRRLPDSYPNRALIEAQALTKAGVKNATAGLATRRAMATGAIIGFDAIFLFAGCLGCWVWYFSARQIGELPAPGWAPKLPHLFDADVLASRGAQLFGGFLVLPSIVTVLGSKLHVLSGVVLLINSAVMIGFVILLFNAPVLGRKLTLEDIGVSTKDLGTKIRWGVGGYFAELPVAMVTALVVAKLLSFLPEAHHPVTDQLLNHHDALSIVSMLIFGAVVAPFWEEIMFRGLLFPALGRVFGKVLPGALVSSFIFASIHPQGITMWLSLAIFANVSCGLVYHTKSLVPSMVMHGLHNLTLLGLTTLMS